MSCNCQPLPCTRIASANVSSESTATLLWHKEILRRDSPQVESHNQDGNAPARPLYDDVPFSQFLPRSSTTRLITTSASGVCILPVSMQISPSQLMSGNYFTRNMTASYWIWRATYLCHAPRHSEDDRATLHRHVKSRGSPSSSDK